MVSSEIRSATTSRPPSQWLQEIAAQLAEMNELKREELGLRQTGQANERLQTRNRKLAQALIASGKRMREDLQNHQAAGHQSLAVKRMQEQLERNDELLAGETQ